MKELTVCRKAIKEQLVYSLLGVALGGILIMYSFQEFIQVMTFSIGIIFLSVGLILAYFLLIIPRYVLSADSIIIKTIFNTNSINFSDISEARYFEYQSKLKLITMVHKGKEFGNSVRSNSGF